MSSVIERLKETVDNEPKHSAQWANVKANELRKLLAAFEAVKALKDHDETICEETEEWWDEYRRLKTEADVALLELEKS